MLSLKQRKPTEGSYQQNNPYLEVVELLNTSSDLLKNSTAHKLSSSKPKQSSTIDLGFKQRMAVSAILQADGTNMLGKKSI